MKKALIVALLAVLAAVVPSASGASGNGELQRQLAEVRRATAKFHNIRAAEAAGYINPGPGHCVAVPGLGGMGVHFVNPRLIFDGRIEATRPEILVYAPSGNRLKLVAVEYMMPTSLWSGSGAPTLFGRRFDGPMPEHEPGTTGEHYDLHAWIWSSNPDGLLATWNPNVTC